jgi:hypothetical protein
MSRHSFLVSLCCRLPRVRRRRTWSHLSLISRDTLTHLTWHTSIHYNCNEFTAFSWVISQLRLTHLSDTPQFITTIATHLNSLHLTWHASIHYNCSDCKEGAGAGEGEEWQGGEGEGRHLIVIYELWSILNRSDLNSHRSLNSTRAGAQALARLAGTVAGAARARR